MPELPDTARQALAAAAWTALPCLRPSARGCRSRRFVVASRSNVARSARAARMDGAHAAQGHRRRSRSLHRASSPMRSHVAFRRACQVAIVDREGEA